LSFWSPDSPSVGMYVTISINSWACQIWLHTSWPIKKNLPKCHFSSIINFWLSLSTFNDSFWVP
jgi:hypothetical protein